MNDAQNHWLLANFDSPIQKQGALVSPLVEPFSWHLGPDGPPSTTALEDLKALHWRVWALIDALDPGDSVQQKLWIEALRRQAFLLEHAGALLEDLLLQGKHFGDLPRGNSTQTQGLSR